MADRIVLLVYTEGHRDPIELAVEVQDQSKLVEVAEALELLAKLVNMVKGYRVTGWNITRAYGERAKH